MEDSKRDSLARRTFSNVIWLGGSQALRQGIAILTTVVLARFLAPSDYGIFTMTNFVSELAQMLINFGMGTVLIQRKEVSQKLLSSCFWINIGVGSFVACALVIAGPWIAGYFGQPILRWLVIASALNLMIAALAVLPQALLSRQLDFRTVAIGTFLGSVIGALSAVVLALAGLGVWALVLQPPIGTAVNTLYLYVRTRWLPNWEFDFEQVRGLLAFSGQLLGSNVLNHFTKNLQSVILGPAIGAAALGLITMAQTVTWLPMAQISQTVVRATFPVFAKMQGDWERLRPALYRASGVIGLLAFPLLAGIGVLAQELMLVVFGAQWLESAPLLRVFSVMAMVQCATTLAGTVLLAAGRADRLLHLDMLGLPIMAGVLWLNRDAPVLHVVFAFAGATAFLQCMGLAVSLRAVGGRWMDYLRPLWRPLAGCLLMSVVLIFMRMGMDSYMPLTKLIVLAISGAIIYIAWSFLVNRSEVLELMNLMRNRNIPTST